jgi:hypothetical protein
MLPGRLIGGGSVLNGQVQDAEEALALHFRMKIQFLGGVLRPSTLLRYFGQVFLLLAGSSPATYFPCWCWWSITNIYIRCIMMSYRSSWYFVPVQWFVAELWPLDFEIWPNI